MMKYMMEYICIFFLRILYYMRELNDRICILGIFMWRCFIFILLGMVNVFMELVIVVEFFVLCLVIVFVKIGIYINIGIKFKVYISK